MPSPIMLPPTPDLHPIRQELLRGLVRAIRMSKRQCRDMALKIAAHGIHTLVKPRARGGLKPAQGYAAHDAGKESFALYVWRSLPSPGDQGVAREGLHSNRHQANSGPSGPNLVRCVFGAGRWPPGAGHHLHEPNIRTLKRGG